MLIDRNTQTTEITFDQITRNLLHERLLPLLEGRQTEGATAALVAAATEAFRDALPLELVETLENWRTSGAVALKIRGLPEQKWGPTPANGFTDDRSFELSNLITFGVMGVAGIAPVSYEYENNGLLFRNVAPVESASREASSWGANQDFSWHTDNPSGEYYEPGKSPLTTIPTYLAFYGIRNNEQVPTEVLPLDRVLNALDPADVRTLMSSSFRVEPPASNVGAIAPLENAPLLERGPASAGGRLVLRFDPNTTTATTAKSQECLARFVCALDAVKYDSPILDSGDFLLFDNRRVLHRRLAFSPHPEPSRRRFLRRCYGVEAALTRGLNLDQLRERNAFAAPTDVTPHDFHRAAVTLAAAGDAEDPEQYLQKVAARELIALGYPSDIDALPARSASAIERLVGYARMSEPDTSTPLLRRAAANYLVASELTSPEFRFGELTQ